MKIIDPHVHLFDLALGNYHWLKAQNPPHWPDKKKINRSFTQQDLRLNENLTLAGFVHIEAGFDNDKPEREIDWLEQTVTLPFKSIAFADLTSANFEQQILALKQRASVIGIRHILDDDATSLLSKPLVQKNLRQLADNRLLFEAQLNLADAPAIIALLNILKQNPSLKVVINHGGFPTVENFAAWLTNLEQLAVHPACWLKLSGWEMSHRQVSFDLVNKVCRQCIDTFGENRVMLASNFPVSNLAHTYQELWQNYRDKLALSANEWHQLSFTNASRCYQLLPE